MTTHRERIQAAIKGEIIDRPPVALWRDFPVDDQSPETLANATLHFQNNYDFDLVKVTPASSFSVKDWGVDDEWVGDTEGTRRYTQQAIHDARDWESLTILEPSAPHLAGQLTCLRLIRAQLGPLLFRRSPADSFHTLSCCNDISMRSDHRHNAACAQYESPATCLLDGVCRL